LLKRQIDGLASLLAVSDAYYMANIKLPSVAETAAIIHVALQHATVFEDEQKVLRPSGAALVKNDASAGRASPYALI
jgi:hypothetical protein